MTNTKLTTQPAKAGAKPSVIGQAFKECHAQLGEAFPELERWSGGGEYLKEAILKGKELNASVHRTGAHSDYHDLSEDDKLCIAIYEAHCQPPAPLVVSSAAGRREGRQEMVSAQARVLDAEAAANAGREGGGQDARQQRKDVAEGNAEILALVARQGIVPRIQNRFEVLDDDSDIEITDGGHQNTPTPDNKVVKPRRKDKKSKEGFMEQMGAGLGGIANVMEAHGQQTARFLDKQNYLKASEMQMQQTQHMDVMLVRREEMMSAKETAKDRLAFDREEAAKKMKLEEMKLDVEKTNQKLAFGQAAMARGESAADAKAWWDAFNG